MEPRNVPDKFAPWSMDGLPPDAASPLDFPEVYLWRDGRCQKIRTDDLPADFEEAGAYWRPVEWRT